jgi:hypothetical protein
MTRRLLWLGSIAGFALSVVMAAVWVGSLAASRRPHAGMRLFTIHLGEGDECAMLAPGRFQRWIYTPWDGQWYAESDVPLWAPLLVLLLATAACRIVPRFLPRPDRLNAFGRCPVCGYDLRATPGRCPECGAVPAEAKP